MKAARAPAIGKARLVVVMNREQILAGCAARGLSLEELRSAAGLRSELVWREARSTTGAMTDATASSTNWSQAA